MNAKRTNDNLTLEVNNRFQCYCLTEEEVNREFLKENYSYKATEKAILQWLACNVAFRLPYKGYRIIGFYTDDDALGAKQ